MPTRKNHKAKKKISEVLDLLEGLAMVDDPGKVCETCGNLKDCAVCGGP